MRLVHYHPSASTGRGGPDIAVREWAEAVAATGHQVAILCERVVEPASSTIDWIDVGRRSGSVRSGHLHRSVLRRDDLRGADVLVMHSGWVRRNPGTARIARAAGVAYVVTPHGAYHPRVMTRRRVTKSLWWHALERPMLARSLLVHLFFEEEKTHLARAGFHGPSIAVPQSVYVPPGAVWKGGEDHLLWFGRLDIEAKGLDLLLRALASQPPAVRRRLHLHGRDWRGSGARLSALVRELDLDAWVDVLPPVYGDDKWDTMQRAAAFVHPSRWDACPMAVLEAAAVGMPLVLTEFPLARFLGARGAALSIPSTVAGLAAALGADAHHDLAALGERARSVLDGELSWATVARRYVAELERALTESSSAPRVEP